MYKDKVIDLSKENNLIEAANSELSRKLNFNQFLL